MQKKNEKTRKGKKVSANITEKNLKKMNEILLKEGISQTEFINQAISGIPIVCLGNRKDLAECFVDLVFALDRLEDGDFYTIKEEVDEVCQSLNLLMVKIEAMSALKKG